MEINVVIVDDDSWALQSLAGLLSLYCPDVKVVGYADSIVAARELLGSVTPDIVFLDIEMPSGSGFDLLDQIDTAKSEIIITTGHDSYAIKAFKASALDYLLKPITREDLLEAIQRYRLRLKPLGSKIKDTLKENLADRNGKITRILIPTYEGFDVLLVESIIYCEANGNYTTFFMANHNTFTSSKTLKEYEFMLASSSFVRVHHKYVVNIRYVKKYIKGRVGTLIMTNGQNISVSDTRKTDLINALQQLQ